MISVDNFRQRYSDWWSTSSLLDSQDHWWHDVDGSYQQKSCFSYAVICRGCAGAFKLGAQYMGDDCLMVQCLRGNYVCNRDSHSSVARQLAERLVRSSPCPSTLPMPLPQPLSLLHSPLASPSCPWTPVTSYPGDQSSPGDQPTPRSLFSRQLPCRVYYISNFLCHVSEGPQAGRADGPWCSPRAVATGRVRVTLDPECHWHATSSVVVISSAIWRGHCDTTHQHI